LALIFGTLLSSQGTDASFVLTLAGFPPGFRSVLFLRFRLYQSLSRLFSAFKVIRFRVFPFRRFRLYQKISTGFPGFAFLNEGLDVPAWNSIPGGRERL
ncbi:hypothetical protein ACIQV3_33520, partial [Streptomyces sp. NPDC099050]|uniref:hypothetical protein n=1 Tax=Streptomyces sp. NPDC099050 TaxID=3366100 RepID=UPI003812A463